MLLTAKAKRSGASETPGPAEATKRGRPIGTPSQKTPSTKTPDQKRTKASEEPAKKSLFEDEPAAPPPKLLAKALRLDSQETLVLGGQ